MKKLLLSLVIVLIITSCTSQRKIMDSWLGSSKQNLIMSWGPPTTIVSDGGTGEIMIYEKSVTIPGYTSSGLATVGTDNKVYQGASTYRQGYTNVKTTMMYINKNGIVYHWRIN